MRRPDMCRAGSSSGRPGGRAVAPGRASCRRVPHTVRPGHPIPPTPCSAPRLGASRCTASASLRARCSPSDDCFQPGHAVWRVSCPRSRQGDSLRALVNTAVITCPRWPVSSFAASRCDDRQPLFHAREPLLRRAVVQHRQHTLDQRLIPDRMQPVVSDEPCSCATSASPRGPVAARGRSALAQGRLWPAAHAPARSVRPCVGPAAAHSGAGAPRVRQEPPVRPAPSPRAAGLRPRLRCRAFTPSVFLRLLTGHAHGALPAAATIATIPTRSAGGRFAHAATTRAKSGSGVGFGVQLLGLWLVVGHSRSGTPAFVVVASLCCPLPKLNVRSSILLARFWSVPARRRVSFRTPGRKWMWGHLACDESSETPANPLKWPRAAAGSTHRRKPPRLSWLARRF